MKQINDYTTRHSAALAIALLLVGLLCVQPVTADTVLINETIENRIDTSGIREVPRAYDFTRVLTNDRIVLNKIEAHSTMHYIGIVVQSSYNALPEGRHEITYTLGNDDPKNAVVYVSYNKNLLGQTVSVRYTLFFYDWDIGTKTGRQVIKLSRGLCDSGIDGYSVPTSGIGGLAGYLNPNYMECKYGYKITVVSSIMFKNHLTVTASDHLYNIQLFREFENSYFSTIELIKNDTVIHRNDGSIDINLYALLDEIDRIKIIAIGNKEYFWNLYGTQDPDPDDPADPDDSTVTVYVKNSQTGALIADANIAIDALVNGEYYPVVNRTEPSGIFSITLQPTGGGQPNPDGYRLIVTAYGYNNPMPEINFTVDDYKISIYCLLDPIAGGPVNENKTFIDFFVRDMSSNPISGATVKFGKYTLITNSAGYTIFEVDKNNNYTWTISKSGYGPLTGNAVIGDAPRHTINTVLAPIVTPTKPTPIPTSPPIGPTPTMTAPTGEPVSNWLEWFAAHFGMILGGGVEIGKIFMWLCFTVPVGVYVGKEAKAGAAGFMAGAGIVTLFFVLIGWVPIWLVVLLALIIGLLYAKVFNSQDNGGGR